MPAAAAAWEAIAAARQAHESGEFGGAAAALSQAYAVWANTAEAELIHQIGADRPRRGLLALRPRPSEVGAVEPPRPAAHQVDLLSAGWPALAATATGLRRAFGLWEAERSGAAAQALAEAAAAVRAAGCPGREVCQELRLAVLALSSQADQVF